MSGQFIEAANYSSNIETELTYIHKPFFRHAFTPQPRLSLCNKYLFLEISAFPWQHSVQFATGPSKLQLSIQLTCRIKNNLGRHIAFIQAQLAECESLNYKSEQSWTGPAYQCY